MIARWAARPRLDWVVAAGVIVAWRLGRTLDLVGPLDLVNAEARRAVYNQAGTIGSIVIGLFVVPVTLALALAPRERLQRVLSHKQGQLRLAVMQAGIAASLLVVFSFVALALDATPTGNRGVRFIAPGVLAVALLSLVRVLRALGALLLLSEVEARPSLADEIRPVPNPAPEDEPRQAIR